MWLLNTRTYELREFTDFELERTRYAILSHRWEPEDETYSFQSIKATIKVSSTETGVIFGSILWEGPGLAEQCVILNDIHIDIMDYIKPAYCNEAQVYLFVSSVPP